VDFCWVFLVNKPVGTDLYYISVIVFIARVISWICRESTLETDWLALSTLCLSDCDVSDSAV